MKAIGILCIANLITLLAGCCVGKSGFLTLEQNVEHHDRLRCEYAYHVGYTPEVPDLRAWNAPEWNRAETGTVGNFYFSGDMPTRFLPETKFRMLYDDNGIYVIFRVHDRYFRAVARDQEPGVNDDGSVELFIQAPPDKRYFNFEANPVGVMWCSYVHEISIGDVKKFSMAEVASLRSAATLSGPLPETVTRPVSYNVGFFIPFAVVEKYTKNPIAVDDLPAQPWRFNAFKLSYLPENPHLASWAGMTKPLFHYPDGFGYMIFSEKPKSAQ